MVKNQFQLTAQMVVRCIASVIDTYAIDKSKEHKFKEFSAITYDARILRWYTEKQTISIWSINGRLKKVPYQCGQYYKTLLENQQGESDLIVRGNEFYLFTTCNIDEPGPQEFDDVIGVDLGVKNIATTSDGEIYSGGKVNKVRNQYRKIRKKLQKKGTKSAKRLLKKRKRKERNFATNENHIIAKKIVQQAKDTNRAIAVENLTGINKRTTVRKSQRAERYSWSFYQLKQFILYKALLAGIEVIEVNPKNTSRACFNCGHVDKKNRPTQKKFKCVCCGFSGHADTIAAENIRRVAVNQPYADKLCA